MILNKKKKNWNFNSSYWICFYTEFTCYNVDPHSNLFLFEQESNQIKRPA